jgi:hypothetical protein
MTTSTSTTDTQKMRSTDTIWYLLLSLMQQFEIKVTREHFKRTIREMCELLGKTRAALGIITGVRAEMWFNGGWSSVSFDAIEDLAANGTDLIFIEKEGIIDEIKEHGDKYGVAFVNSRGYLSEYAHDLIEAANASGANITLISDYDLSGIHLASKCDASVHFITMDDSTLQYFGLPKDNKVVVEASNTKLINIVEQIVQTDSRFAHLDIEFLRKSRIEINAVIAQVGDERFWEFIKEKVEEHFPTRNYNRAIDTPSKDKDADQIDLYPKGMKSLIRHYREKVSEVVEDEEDKIVKEQEKVEGFLDVAEQKKKNKERVMKVIADNDDIAKIETEVIEVCEKLDIEVKEDDEQKDGQKGSSDSTSKSG